MIASLEAARLPRQRWLSTRIDLGGIFYGASFSGDTPGPAEIENAAA